MVNELTGVMPDEISAETAKDPVFGKIMDYVMQVWPDSRRQGQKRSATLLDPLYGDHS